MKRDAFTQQLAFPGELIIDNFAGGGGTSTGLERAFGRPVDIAINHDPEALAMHALNHPHTLHLCESVWDVDPVAVTKSQPVGLVWLSPDCKHFSKAKGGTPVAKNIRGLAWIGVRWVVRTKPRGFMLENVEEFQTWGPLRVDEHGNAYPDPAKKGQTFRLFRQMLTTGVPLEEREGNESIDDAREALCTGPLGFTEAEFALALNGLRYTVECAELKASDYSTPTIRKRFFMVGRRDGLPTISQPPVSHGAPDSLAVRAGKLAAHRTAAECIDFDLPAESIFGRKRPLVPNTMRRVAKGLMRHVLTSASPFIVTNTTGHPGAGTSQPLSTIITGNHHMVGQPVLAPYLTEHANASNQRTMPADEPLRTVCAQVKGGHFSMVAPMLAPLRGTTEQHLIGHTVEQPLSTVAASGTHHALVAAHITKFNTGSVGSAMDTPLPTITAGGTPKRPSTGIQMGMVGAHLVTVGYGERPGQEARTQPIEQPLGTAVAGGIKQALVAAHLVDMGHGEGKCGTKRFSHGIRSIEVPLNTVTASGATSALVAACLEQANGGFYEGDGRAADAPMSTITAAGSNQRLVNAYLVKYYSEGGTDSACSEPMHTIPTKARMGLVQTVQMPAAALAPEHAERARQCAALLHEYLPEHFTQPADMVLMQHAGQWWVLVDITLRMLKPRELYRAQGFPNDYQFEEIPDPALLFADGQQTTADPLSLPRIPLSTTAQVRMCGNSVCPPVAEALARANFAHEAAWMQAAA